MLQSPGRGERLWVSVLPPLLLSKIIWLVPRLPLDVAAQAGFLFGRNSFSTDERVESSTKVFARDGNAISGAAIVELTAIDEAMVAVEQEKIWRTRSAIGVSRSL